MTTSELLGTAPRPARGIAGRLARRPLAVASLLVVAFWVAMALGGWRLLAPSDPLAVDPRHALRPPGAGHWLGTDQLGRDVLARVLAGATTVLAIAPAATLLSLLLGTLLGMLAGYRRGAVDTVLMRLVDVLLAIPAILASVLTLSLLGPSPATMIAVIGGLFAPLVARTVRAATLEQAKRDYVAAARLRREPDWYVLSAELLPNITGPLLVEGTIRLGYAVFAASTLSFLGFGLRPPSPDWGLSIAAGRGLLQVAPWMVLAPAAALASLVVAVNLLGDQLQEALEP